jgi:hypothetical protein
MKAYFFLCDHVTEGECLTRQLAGTTEFNVEWALEITPGDYIFIYNFQTGDIWGPFQAASRVDCYELHAWRGKFPVQVRLAKSASSRKANLIGAKRNEFFTSRGARPPHVLEGPLLGSLLSWIAEEGTDF